jgi:hypothetical protein
MKKSIFFSLAAVLLFGSAAWAQRLPDDASAAPATPTYTAVLYGSNENPAADPKAVGFAEVTLDPVANTVTFWLEAPDLDNVNASHIHRGAAGVNGPVVIPFNQPFPNGFSMGTTTGVAPSLIAEIMANPANFYVNIHNNQFPGGAVRGQMTTAPGTAVGPCTPNQTTLCLNQGRFKVQVAFQTATATGVGIAVPQTGDTGSFWFFSANNVELMVKLVDGRPVNGKFWFFSGALSDVAYTITVTDLVGGTTKTYTASQGQQAALNDTSAF